MRSLLILFLTFNSIGHLALGQNNKIIGSIRLQNSGGKGIEGVEIRSRGAKTAFSETDGEFEIVFNSKKTGDYVNEIRLIKEGYSLINEEKSKDLFIPNDPTLAPIKLVMAPDSIFRVTKLKYYDLLIEDFNSTSEIKRREEVVRRSELNDKIKKLDVRIEEYASTNRELLIQRDSLLTELQRSNEKIRNLDLERSRLIVQAEPFAQYLASINKDDISEIDKKALGLVEQGKVQEAIELLPNDVLFSDLDKSKKELKEAEANLVQKQEQVDKNLDRILFKARLVRSKNQNEEAKLLYKVVLEEDSTNAQVLTELAQLYRNSLSIDEAIKTYNASLKYERSPVNRINTLIELGDFYGVITQYEKAVETANKAISTYYKSSEAQEVLSKNKLADLYISLGNYRIKGRGKNFEKAITILKSIPTDQKDSEYWVSYGSYYESIGQEALYNDKNELARLHFNEYLNVYSELSKRDSSKYLPYLASGYNYMALTYPNFSKKSHNYLKQAYQTFQSIDILSSGFCQHCFAIVQLNLFDQVLAKGDYQQALSLINSAVKNLTQLALVDKAFLPDLVNAKTSLGDYYLQTNQFTKANNEYTESLNYHEEYLDYLRGLGTYTIYGNSEEVAYLKKNFLKIRSFSNPISKFEITPVGGLLERPIENPRPIKEVKKDLQKLYKGAETQSILPLISGAPIYYTESALKAKLSISLGDYEISEVLLNEALSKINDEFSNCYYLFDLGVVTKLLGNETKSTKHFRESLKLINKVLESTPELLEELKAELSLLKSKVALELGQYEMSESTLNELLQRLENIEKTEPGISTFMSKVRVKTSIQRARLFAKKELHGQSIDLYLQSLEANQQLINSQQHKADLYTQRLNAYREISQEYFKHGKVEEAIITINELDSLTKTLLDETSHETNIYLFERVKNDLAACQIYKSLYRSSLNDSYRQAGLLLSERIINSWDSFYKSGWYDIEHSILQTARSLNTFFLEK